MFKKLIVLMFVIAFAATFFGMEKTGALGDLNLVSFVVLRGKDGDGLYNVDFVSTVGSNSGESSDIIYSVVSTRGASFGECVDKAENNTAKTIFFGHMKSIFFEEGFLSDSRNFERFDDYIKRNSYFNYYLTMYVLNDPKSKFIEALEKEDKATMDFVNNTVRKFPLEGILTVKYNEYISDLPSACLPYIVMNDTPAISGTALLKDNKLVKTYSYDESKIYKLLSGKGNNIYIPFPNGDIHVQNMKVKTEYDSPLKLRYIVKLCCQLDSYYQNKNEKTGDLSSIEKEIEDYFTEKSYEYIGKLKTEAKCDALGVGRYVYRHDNKLYNSLNLDDFSIFERSDITVEYKVHIVRNGIIY